MLKTFKKHALKAIYHYHYHMTNYYYKHNGYWGDKVAKHVYKEFELVDKLVQMGES